MPAGKIHAGESVKAAAVRELSEKVGLRDDDLVLKFQAHVRIFQGDQLVSDYFAFVFVGRYNGVISGGEWYDSAGKSDDKNLAPGVRELIDFAKSDEAGFRQLEIKLRVK